MRDKSINFLDGIFVFLLTVCSLQCLASSFHISVNSWVVSLFTAVFVLVFALLATFVESKRKYTSWLGVVFALFLIFVFLFGNSLLAELNYAVNKVFSIYSQYLPVAQRVYFSKSVAISATGLFVALSALLSGLLTLLIIRIRRILPATILSIITVVPCFLLVNTLPALLPLLTMCAVLFALFISNPIRRTGAPKGGVISFVIALLMAVVVFCVYCFNPVVSYKRSDWQDELLNFAMSLTGKVDEVDNSFSASVKNVRQKIDLSDEGYLKQTHTPVMTVETSFSGKLYLRGVAYANYKGNEWSILTDEQAESYPDYFSSAVMTKSSDARYAVMNIITKNEESVIYTPYYFSYVPNFSTEMCDVLVRNDTGTKNYDVTYQMFETEKYSATDRLRILYSAMGASELEADENWYSFYCEQSAQFDDYKDFVYSNYLDVPEDVKAEMQSIAQENGFTDLQKAQLVDEVKSYVRNSARYSLDTQRVPQGKDISTWLLKESDTGYCVHFATSLAVMLRSLDIPARYVTGYCVESNPNDFTAVTSDNAHAWVEYFDDDMGWVPIDSTPPDFTSIVGEVEDDDTSDSGQTETQLPSQSQTEAQPTEPATDANQAGVIHSTVDSAENNNAYEGGKPVAIIILNIIATVFALILLSVIILILRRFVVLKLRVRSFSSSSRNNRAKNIYRYIIKTAEHSHIPIPQEVSDIAEKARFSNGKISSDELDIMLLEARKRENTLLEDVSFTKKLYLKYILALV